MKNFRRSTYRNLRWSDLIVRRGEDSADDLVSASWERSDLLFGVPRHVIIKSGLSAPDTIREGGRRIILLSHECIGSTLAWRNG